jgi:hypothetical protein
MRLDRDGFRLLEDAYGVEIQDRAPELRIYICTCIEKVGSDVRTPGAQQDVIFRVEVHILSEFYLEY